jgi:D-alanyl-lipoteichoic acid acyltransferase DltB (MBOAT superfamily)
VTFNSLQYAVFLPLVLAVYWRLSHRGQNALLLLASYAFYALWNWRFVGLMMLSTATDYTVGLALDRTDDDRRRKVVFATSLVVNLGVLGFFKYYDFFVDEGIRVLGVFGLRLDPPLLHVLLPIGISFYTFHGISYTFDVFRRDIRPARSLVTFGVFVSFFPQLVAGPIGRAQLQLPQFEQPRRRPDRERVTSALYLIGLGLVKKVAIADALAPFANRAFGNPGSHGWIGLVVGVYAFALQIYADFSGYSDMARGSARLLGIELPINFEQPYLSRNATEFWRRWHISLSTWLRDYLYVPLGGNRNGRRAMYRNLLLTMLIGGLWHGAALTFVIWGGLHGALLVAHRMWRRVRGGEARTEGDPLTRADVWLVLATFHATCLAWIFFRAPTFGSALSFLARVARLQPGPIDVNAAVTVVVAAAALLLIDLAQRRALDHEVVLTWTPAARGLAFGLGALLVLVYSGGTPVPFIYFQF